MNKEIKNILIIGLASLDYCFGQQFGVNSMYNMDPYLLNTATAGLKGKSLISLSYRNQWEKFEGSPANFQVNYTSPVRVINGAYGFSIQHLKEGLINTTRLITSYNQVWTRSRYLLSGSLGLNDQISKLDYNNVRTPDGEYSSTTINHNDPNLLNSPISQHALGVNLSLYAQTRILEGGIEFSTPILHTSKHLRAFLKSEHLLKIYLFKEFNIDQIAINASLFDYTDFVENQEEIQANLVYRNQLSGGILIRGLRPKSLDAVGIQFSFNLSRGIWVAYHLEWPLNVLKNQINSINQQFGLKFEFNTLNNRKRHPVIYNPRW